MPGYRRWRIGRMVFLTVVTAGRRRLFAGQEARLLLREAMERTAEQSPWTTEGIVLLPDHLHMLWLLPEGDLDYSGRLAAMKKRFTRAYLRCGRAEAVVPAGQRRHRLRGIWQRRFWEHTIRDARDFRLHLDYIHLNPVKHGLAKCPADWSWSSFHRYVEQGWYEADWVGRADLPGSVEYVWTE